MYVYVTIQVLVFITSLPASLNVCGHIFGASSILVLAFVRVHAFTAFPYFLPSLFHHCVTSTHSLSIMFDIFMYAYRCCFAPMVTLHTPSLGSMTTGEISQVPFPSGHAYPFSLAITTFPHLQTGNYNANVQLPTSLHSNSRPTYLLTWACSKPTTHARCCMARVTGKRVVIGW